MARNVFIYDSNENLLDRMAKYYTQSNAIAARIGWPTASVTALKAQLDGVTTAARAVLDAQVALDTADSLLNTAKGTAMPVIRMDSKNLKATHGFTEGDAKTLGVYVTPETFESNTYRPVLEATARHNYVDLIAKKLGVDSLNLYWRPAGTATWNLRSAKGTRFPFHDAPRRPADRPCRRESTWRWASSATTRSATRATSPARCFRRRPSPTY